MYEMKAWMNKKIWSYGVIAFLIIPLLTNGADAAVVEKWNKTFGNTGHDRACSVRQAADGGYIKSGNSDERR